jgi:hypothetical protein
MLPLHWQGLMSGPPSSSPPQHSLQRGWLLSKERQLDTLLNCAAGTVAVSLVDMLGV